MGYWLGPKSHQLTRSRPSQGAPTTSRLTMKVNTWGGSLGTAGAALLFPAILLVVGGLSHSLGMPRVSECFNNLRSAKVVKTTTCRPGRRRCSSHSVIAHPRSVRRPPFFLSSVKHSLQKYRRTTVVTNSRPHSGLPHRRRFGLKPGSLDGGVSLLKPMITPHRLPAATARKALLHVQRPFPLQPST